MRYGLSLLTALAWALWLGGAITLFLMVIQLFGANRPVAIDAAPVMFDSFARYQIALAAVAVIASAFWRLREPRGVLTAVFSFFAISAICTVLIAAVITPRIDDLRQHRESKSPQFQRLHKQASMLYMGEAGLLLIVGILLPVAMRPRR